MFWRVLKTSFVRFYDHLGKCVWMNLLWFVLSITVILFPPATAALFRSLNEAVRYEDPDIKSFFTAFRRFFLRSWLLFLAQALVIAGLVAAAFIYLEHLTNVIGTAAVVLFFICLWMLLYFTAILGYMWAFLVHQDTGVWTAAKRATLLFFMTPFTTIGLFLIVSVLTLVGGYFMILLPFTFFLTSFVAVLWNVTVLAALEELPE
jgi:uncharacterized membrane protein YesL